MPRPTFLQLQLKTASFFDRDLGRAISKGHKRALSRFGAFVMSDARKSMKTARALKRTKNTIEVYRPRFHRSGGAVVQEGGKRIRVSRKASRPGQPPRAVKGHIKRFLFFDYEDRQGPNVVIGPYRLDEKTTTKHPVPAMHEQRKRSHAYVTRRRVGRRRKTVTQRYPQRPYMVPAFKKNKKKLRKIYKGVVRR